MQNYSDISYKQDSDDMLRPTKPWQLVDMFKVSTGFWNIYKYY